MQLNASERALLAYFPSRESASAAFNLLKQQGFLDVDIDEIPSPVAVEDLGRTHFVNSLSQLSGAPIADPWEAGCRWLVTVVTPLENTTRAVELLRSCGAYIK